MFANNYVNNNNNNYNNYYRKRRCSFVPWLVDQFNDIIEWNAQIVQNDLEYQQQRTKNSCNYQRRYSLKNDPLLSSGLQRSATDSSINKRYDFNDLIFNKNLYQQQSPLSSSSSSLLSTSKKKRTIKLRLKNNQDDLNEKLNKLRKELNENRIDESNNENNDDNIEQKNVIQITTKTTTTTTLQIDSIQDELFEHQIIFDDNENNCNQQLNNNIIDDNENNETFIDENNNSIIIENENKDKEIEIEDKVSKELEEKIEKQVENEKEEIEIKDNILNEIEEEIEKEVKNKKEELEIENKVEKEVENKKEEIEIENKVENVIEKEIEKEIENEQEQKQEKMPIMNNFNLLLEKLSKSYRHQFQVKTAVKQNNIIINNSNKDKRPLMNCFCGKEFNFSEKYLKCFNCLTNCHTQCSQLIPQPCIKYVDPFIRPSKLITNFIFPRSKPLIPSILIQLCRRIEQECQLLSNNYNNKTNFELYYVNNEILKIVKDKCKQLLNDAKNGLYLFDNNYNLNHLCGMVKYFLGDMIEPLFSKQLWKDFSTIIHKKSDDELRDKILDSFKHSFNQADLHSFCFILLHLKHLIRYGLQNKDIIANIFCPILMGDIECKRKLRLMKIILNLDENLIYSFAQF